MSVPSTDVGIGWEGSFCGLREAKHARTEGGEKRVRDEIEQEARRGRAKKE